MQEKLDWSTEMRAFVSAPMEPKPFCDTLQSAAYKHREERKMTNVPMPETILREFQHKSLAFERQWRKECEAINWRLCSHIDVLRFSNDQVYAKLKEALKCVQGLETELNMVRQARDEFARKNQELKDRAEATEKDRSELADLISMYKLRVQLFSLGSESKRRSITKLRNELESCKARNTELAYKLERAETLACSQRVAEVGVVMAIGAKSAIAALRRDVTKLKKEKDSIIRESRAAHDCMAKVATDLYYERTASHHMNEIIQCLRASNARLRRTLALRSVIGEKIMEMGGLQ
jgi:chromosome segregation ATPase